MQIVQAIVVALVMLLLRSSDDFSDSGPVPRMYLHMALVAAVLLLLAALMLAEALRLLALLAEALALAVPWAGVVPQAQRAVQMHKLQVLEQQQKGQAEVSEVQWEDAAGQQQQQQQQLWLC